MQYVTLRDEATSSDTAATPSAHARVVCTRAADDDDRTRVSLPRRCPCSGPCSCTAQSPPHDVGDGRRGSMDADTCAAHDADTASSSTYARARRTKATADVVDGDATAASTTGSLRDVYASCCARMCCTVLPSVVRLLPDATRASCASLVSLDLSRLYVGARGACAILAVCARLPQLRHLDLSDNYIDNEVVWRLAQLTAQQPSLASLELRENAAVSWSGAMCLAQLVMTCARVTHVGLDHTHVDADTVEAIFAYTRRNAAVSFAASGRGQMPSVHAAAIHIRAMRRFFAELQQRQEQQKDDDKGDDDGGTATAAERRGAVPVTRLYDGLVERLRVLGKLHEVDAHVPAAYARLRRVAPGPYVHWDAFLVLLFVEHAPYSQVYVDRLRRVFAEFDVVPHAHDVYVDGYVDVDELPRIYTRLHGVLPRPHEMTFLHSLLSLQPHMTLRWDDFLYVMYIRAGTVGARAVGVTRTAMPRPARLLHY